MKKLQQLLRMLRSTCAPAPTESTSKGIKFSPTSSSLALL
eukprot:SAG31_NODE_45338_length_259_cov_0.650000_1_plen_39_part_01